MNDPGKIVILGAGPTGLAAGYRLLELGFKDFVILEAGEEPGGLARSVVDRRGFTWDIGGHVHFSHYDYYDGLLRRALGDRWLEHERNSWIWIRGRFVPYPLQNHLSDLDEGDQRRCLAGLAAARRRRPKAPQNFREWIEATCGAGIAEIFLLPYNRKVWGYPLERLGIKWVGERVAVPDAAEMKKTLPRGGGQGEWGPNAKFRFPLRGGSGAICKGLAKHLPAGSLRLGKRVGSVDLEAGKARCRDGQEFKWSTLVTTIPLDRFCGMAKGLSSGAARASQDLLYSSVHLLGVGLKGFQPEPLVRKSWIYFPENNSPYYRATVFSNYSPHNVPPGDQLWSLLAEVCATPFHPVEKRGVKRDVLHAMHRDGLVPEGAEVVSLWEHVEKYAYPTPELKRDRVLERVLPELEKRRVYSRGRFGAWKYEVGNQDHSAMQGVELVNRLLNGGPEPTLSAPELVNSGIFRKVPEVPR